LQPTCHGHISMTDVNIYNNSNPSTKFPAGFYETNILSGGDVENVTRTGSITVSMWLRLHDTRPNSPGPLFPLPKFLVSCGGGDGFTEAEFYFAVFMSEGGALCYGHGLPSSPVTFKSSYPLAAAVDGEWHHVAMVRNVTSKTITLYEDGEELCGVYNIEGDTLDTWRPYYDYGTESNTASPGPNIRIGGLPNFGVSVSESKFDWADVRIFDYAMTKLDIVDIAMAPVNVMDSSLVANYAGPCATTDNVWSLVNHAASPSRSLLSENLDLDLFSNQYSMPIAALGGPPFSGPAFPVCGSTESCLVLDSPLDCNCSGAIAADYTPPPAGPLTLDGVMGPCVGTVGFTGDAVWRTADGVDVVSLAPALLGDMTVSMWVRPDISGPVEGAILFTIISSEAVGGGGAPPTSTDAMVMVGFGEHGEIAYLHKDIQESGGPGLKIFSKDPYSRNDRLRSGHLRLGVWQHLALVRVDNTVTLYINGEEIPPLTAFGFSNQFDDYPVRTEGVDYQLFLGGAPAGPGQPFLGRIAEVRVYAGAVDPTIAFSRGLTTAEQGLPVLYFPGPCRFATYLENRATSTAAEPLHLLHYNISLGYDQAILEPPETYRFHCDADHACLRLESAADGCACFADPLTPACKTYVSTVELGLGYWTSTVETCEVDNDEPVGNPALRSLTGGSAPADREGGQYSRGVPLSAEAPFLQLTEETVISGEAGDGTGQEVIAIGDFNGDRFPDYVVTAPYFSPTGFPLSGRVVVLYGREKFDAEITLTEEPSLPENVGFIITGLHSNQTLGIAISSGDWNNDGLADILIGSRDTGAFLLLGRYNGFPEGFFSLLDLQGLSTEYGNYYDTSGECCGSSVALLDFDGDGLDDVVIGCPCNTVHGKGYIITDHTPGSMLVDEFEIASANVLGHYFYCALRDFTFAARLARGGDVNGDTFEDLVVSNTGTDTVFVVFGQPNPITFPTYILDETLTPGGYLRITTDAMPSFFSLGATVGGGEDLNLDGFDDVVVVDSNGDKVYVVYGFNHTDLTTLPEIRVEDLGIVIGLDVYHGVVIDSTVSLGERYAKMFVYGDGSPFLMLSTPGGVTVVTDEAFTNPGTVEYDLTFVSDPPSGFDKFLFLSVFGSPAGTGTVGETFAYVANLRCDGFGYGIVCDPAPQTCTATKLIDPVNPGPTYDLCCPLPLQDVYEDLRGDITLSMWVRLDMTPGGFFEHALLSIMPPFPGVASEQDNALLFFFVTDDGHYAYVHQVGSGDFVKVETDVSQGFAGGVFDNEWHHLVIQRYYDDNADGPVVRIFEDGVEMCRRFIASSAVVEFFPVLPGLPEGGQNSVFSVGGLRAHPPGFTNGSFAEIRIYTGVVDIPLSEARKMVPVEERNRLILYYPGQCDNGGVMENLAPQTVGQYNLQYLSGTTNDPGIGSDSCNPNPDGCLLFDHVAGECNCDVLQSPSSPDVGLIAGPFPPLWVPGASLPPAPAPAPTVANGVPVAAEEVSIVVSPGNSVDWSVLLGPLLLTASVSSTPLCSTQSTAVAWTCLAEPGACPCPAQDPGTGDAVELDPAVVAGEVAADGQCVQHWLVTAAPVLCGLEDPGQIVEESVSVMYTGENLIPLEWSGKSLAACGGYANGTPLELEVLPSVGGLPSGAYVQYLWSVTRSDGEPGPDLTACFGADCALGYGGNPPPGAAENPSAYSSALLVRDGVLETGVGYAFSVVALPVSGDGSALPGFEKTSVALCEIVPAAPPVGVTCDFDIPVVAALELVPLSCSGGSDPAGYPITYEFYYYSESGYSPMGPPGSVGSADVRAPGEGELLVAVAACNSVGACTEPMIIEVTVLPLPPDYDFDAAEAEVVTLAAEDPVAAGIFLLELYQASDGSGAAVDPEGTSFAAVVDGLVADAGGDPADLPAASVDLVANIVQYGRCGAAGNMDALSTSTQAVGAQYDYGLTLRAVSDCLDVTVEDPADLAGDSGDAAEGLSLGLVDFGVYDRLTERVFREISSHVINCGREAQAQGGQFDYGYNTVSAARMNQADTVLTVPGSSVRFTLPSGFGREVQRVLAESGYPGVVDYCVGFHRTAFASGLCTGNSALASAIQGLTLYATLAEDIGVELEFADLPDDMRIAIEVPRVTASDGGRRFELARDEETRVFVAEQEEMCFFDDGAGCVFAYYTPDTGNPVYLCNHLSNFAELFGTDGDDWSTIRIVSVALLLTVWVCMALFFLAVSTSKRIRVEFGLETTTEKENRVLGAQD